MRVSIVGHGRSLNGSKLGSQIDSSEKVVRLKGSHAVLDSEDYGSKVDALCASTEIMGTFFKMDATEYWAYPKKGSFDGGNAIQAIAELGKPVMIPMALSYHWNQEFLRMGGQHPNVSTGMAAIIFSCYRWSPDVIRLFGFDTLLDPSKSFTRDERIPRSGYGYIDHDWETENKLLDRLKDVYGVRFE